MLPGANPYFGKAWNRNIAACHPQTATPVGTPCFYCEEPVADGDQGLIIPCGMVPLPIHLDCHLRQIIGSVGHQRKRCSCYGGTEEDPPGMTKRQAAEAAARMWEEGLGTPLPERQKQLE